MNTTRPKFVAPFPAGDRAAGVLLHVTSLPSPYGIGDLGPSAIAWIDRLAAAGQSWWQVLPLGPIGFGHSPYQALSSFAANPLVISPDRLIEDGLLTATECGGHSFASDYVDFERVTLFKDAILALAWENFKARREDPIARRLRAIPRRHGRAAGRAGPVPRAAREIRASSVYAVADANSNAANRWPSRGARDELADSIDRFRFGQFCLFRQWNTLKDHANRRGVQLLGDLPIFVSPDSADVWANPELFLLDEKQRPRVVAGVPPDYFSADGQLWGNPLYDWDALRRTDYRWWIERLRARLGILDAIRIDHFRGFEAAWHVPAGAATAATGHWVPGPGADFFEKAREALGGLPLLAEDLGLITPAVTALRDQFQLPGMRVLQFAFNGDPKQSAPAKSLRPQRRRLHRHARQRHDARLVRRGAGTRAGQSLEISRSLSGRTA